MPPQNSNNILPLKILLHAGFFVSGITAVLIGQVLPLLAARFSLNDAESGLFFPAQFAGSLTGTLFTSWLGKRGRFVFASAFGCCLMGLGIAVLNADSFGLCLLGFLINGLGIGLTLPAINVLILEFNPQNSASALSILNFFWGAGAIVSQPFVDFFARGTNLQTPTLILTAILFVIGAAIFLQPKNLERKLEVPGENDEKIEKTDALAPIWTMPLAWAIALFGFVHVGFESAMGGWLKTYTERVETAGGWFPPIFLYFVFFVVGRGIAPVFFKFLHENAMILLGLLTILAGMSILLGAQTLAFLSFGACLAGFGTSWIFPTNVSRFIKVFGETASRRATPLFLFGTLGAFFTTWFIGYLSNIYGGNLRAGMLILLGSILFLIVLQIILSFQKKLRA